MRFVRTVLRPPATLMSGRAPGPGRAVCGGRTGAANSLREGLAEMFTVSRLGIDGRLAKTLVTSNPVESMISIARTTNRNVTRWRDGHMVLRWTAAGMLNAERSFRRIKGYKQMPQLVEALHRHTHPDTAATTETVGVAA